MEKENRKPDWMALLSDALEKPGMLTSAYRAFHNYSVANAMLVTAAAYGRGLQIGPVASYRAWEKKGYQVKKGERALPMLMPVMVSATKKADVDAGAKKVKVNGKKVTEKGESDEKKRRIFIMKNNWFVLDQVASGPDAETLPESETPAWSFTRAVETLGIPVTQFDTPDGNMQGFCRKRPGEPAAIAINPLARFPVKTGAHEMAHAMLGHLGDGDQEMLAHGESPDSSALAEAEAESVAYLVACSLGLEEEALSSARAYIQGYLGANSESFVKKSAARVFACADKILKAGSAKSEPVDVPVVEGVAS